MAVNDIDCGSPPDKAGFIWLAAMATMARLQRFRVIRVNSFTAGGKASVRLARPLVTEFDRKFYRYGYRKSRTQVERGVLVLIAGAVALDIGGAAKRPFKDDPGVISALRILEEVDWWRSEARSHLDLLRHQATRLFARTSEWRTIVAIADLLGTQPVISETQLRKIAAEARIGKLANGCEHFVVLQRDSQLPSLTDVKKPVPNHQTVVACEPVRHDGVVTPAILRRSLAAVSDSTHFAELRRRLCQTEPDLMVTIEREAHAAVNQLDHVPQFTRDSAAAAAIVRCGIFVADAIQRGHSSLWETTERP